MLFRSTALILDIFAQHAKSKEGQAQVELAQLQYMKQRLRGWGGNLSRQAGGQVGGAGAGTGNGRRSARGCHGLTSYRTSGGSRLSSDVNALRSNVAAKQEAT